MNYTEIYIVNEGETNKETDQKHKIYFLPGLIDSHTPGTITEEELIGLRKTYNRLLEGFMKKRVDLMNESLDEKERINLEYDIEYCLEEMHKLLQKIGRYTNDEKLKGFK